MPAPPSRPADSRRRWLAVAVAVAVTAGIVLRFIAPSPMWLDEAQTVEIARQPLHTLLSDLRQDGSPPLYYLLLHGWMKLVGTGTFQIRALSGLFSVAAIPVAALAARRLRLTDGASWPAVLVFATCPFLVRYGSEARMYSLVLLLILLGLVAFERVWSTGGRWAFVGAAACTGALVWTHYWTMFLVAAAIAGSAIAVYRGSRRSRRVLLALVVGCLTFAPWLPTFAYQSAHTGAHWGSPPGIGTPWLAPGSWAGEGISGPLLRTAYYLLIALALVGVVRVARGITFRRQVRVRPLVLTTLAVATLAIATIVSELGSTSYAARYTVVAAAPLLLVVASGFGVLPGRLRTGALVVVCGLGLVGSAAVPGQLRTQAGQVADALKSAGPNDLVVFCPDQLGPAVYRAAPNAGHQVVYPTFGPSARVDWVNYASRNDNADPQAFAARALQMARGHSLWLVYAAGYPTTDGDCLSLYTAFTASRGQPTQLVKASGSSFERESLEKFPAR